MTEDQGGLCHAVQTTLSDARQKISDARNMLSGTDPEWGRPTLDAEHIAHIRAELDTLRRAADSMESRLSQPA